MRKTSFLTKIQIQRRFTIQKKYNYKEMDLKKGEGLKVTIEKLEHHDGEEINFDGNIQALNRVRIPREKFNKSDFEIGEIVKITIEKIDGGEE